MFGNSILQKEASFFHAQKRVKGRLHKILYTILSYGGGYVRKDTGREN
ncbi:hypothetical protein SAMN05421839_1941 [Halolactibacillus halophilus]|uniref:Uncharacterized protein n=1 Tax=Halolactibacillus halophilus TaxID=306540 RepID=A0A1I5TJR3_9BACI|nr:hypothetical protein SAMN05421839_1941 [Halolactibacillus halophilus]